MKCSEAGKRQEPQLPHLWPESLPGSSQKVILPESGSISFPASPSSSGQLHVPMCRRAKLSLFPS